MILILFACYILSLLSAYRVASRLAPSSLLLTSALTIFFWIVNLILPVIYVGMINLLRPEAMIVAGVLLWGTEIVLAGRLRPLPSVEFAPDDGRFRLFRRAGYLVCGLFFVAVVVLSLQLARVAGPLADIDAAWHYLPAMINMVQAGTLNYYKMDLGYFPYAYETVLSWELVLNQTYVGFQFFHQIWSLGILLLSSAILQVLLKSRPALFRDVATFALVTVLLASDLTLGLLAGTGKTDILLLFATLMAVYFLLRYWAGEKVRDFLVLAGIACGVMVTSKLTAAIWLIVIAFIHLVYLGKARAFTIQGVWKDVLTLGLPFLVMTLPWLIRALGYDFSRPSPEYIANFDRLARTFTITRLWNEPTFVAQTLERVPDYLPLWVGLPIILLTHKNKRWLWLTGIGILLVLLGALSIVSYPAWDASFALYWSMLIVSLVLLIIQVWKRNWLPYPLVMAIWLTFGTTALLAFFPWSAWIYEVPYLTEFTYRLVAYRYAPGTYHLFFIVVAAAITYLMTKPTDIAKGTVSIRSASRWGYLLLPLTILLLAANYAGSDMRQVIRRYADFAQHHPEPTPFYEWFHDSVANSSIYSINAPPLMFYGAGLSNSVYFINQRPVEQVGYRWDSISRMIDEHQMDYIAVSFNYPEMLAAGLAPTPEVLAEIDMMRANLRTVFEDEHITLFATQYAENVPAPPGT
jgi:hypothetical protein